ncbi:uncharacterized protein LOC100876972 isoform X1 [Megachile rotundata]|uniref:uncharacterized protein LOC100876972 isoform X1 n=1 Tax=Megachile rotundata TaxID=143995 RepID=UPI003FD12DBA
MTPGKPIVVHTELEILGDYSLQLNRWMLSAIGAWPKSQSTKFEKIVSILLIVTCYFFVLITVLPCILHLIFEDDDLRTKVIILGPLSHWFLGGVGYTTLLVHNKEIKWCVDQVKSDWRNATRPEVQQLMLKDAKFGRYVVAFCATLMQCAVAWFSTGKALTTEIIMVGNETRIMRMLPCTAYRKLIPVHTSPTYELVLIAQYISGVIVNNAFAGAFSLATVFTIHAHSQLNVLMMSITELVDRSRGQKSFGLNDIDAIVEKHLSIYSFISHIEAIMNEICFMELFKCTFSVCLLGYYILMEWAQQDFRSMTTYISVLSSMTFNIFMLCFIGETIMEQASLQ